MSRALQVACTAGAILGGASPNDVANMEQFSDAIGLAFQVADDILDCTQTTEQLGKTAGKVLHETITL
jgi:geranylgeranyl diphosphate synthase, type II